MSIVNATAYRRATAVRTPIEEEVEAKNVKATAARLAVLAADCDRHGMTASLPRAVATEGRTAAQLREWISTAEAAAERVETELRSHLTDQAFASIRTADGRSLATVSADPAAGEQADRADDIAMYVGQHLDPQVAREERVAIAAGLMELGPDMWKDELGHRIQAANERIARAAAAKAEAERKEAEAAALAEELPRHLEAVLGELGYRVDEVEPGLTRGTRLWEITNPEWHNHAVQATLKADGGFRTELVRIGDGEPDGDEERGGDWCNAEQRLRDRVAEAGFASEQIEAIAPDGDRPLKRVRRKSRTHTAVNMDQRRRR